ncbi:MAG: S41 family peptidase, partial [Myxococcota bacterium]
DAYTRIRRITTLPGGKGSLEIPPGADRIIFSGSFDGEPSLVSIDYKGADRKVISPGANGGVSVSLTGDKAVFIKAGTANAAPVKGGKVDAYPIDAPVAIDIAAQQKQKFLEAARTFGDRFYHPTMKGLDWPGLTRRFEELATKTRTSESFNRVTQLLFGETEGSHTGIVGGPTFAGGSPGTGYLGVRVKQVAGGYEVTHVAPDSPASHKQSRINVGDVILSVDGRKLAPDAGSMPTLDLDASFMNRAGRETLVELKRGPAPAPKPEDGKPAAAPGPYVVIIPISGAAWTGLRYEEEINERRAEVDRLSGGKLGYLHIRAMGEAEVREFERDLYAAAHGKDGLIIDVRDNGGGSTADVLLTSLTSPQHAYTIPRGADPKTVPTDSYPRDRRLIYGWTRPINVLINEHSFS